jgi:hypothetical protein
MITFTISTFEIRKFNDKFKTRPAVKDQIAGGDASAGVTNFEMSMSSAAIATIS